MKVYLFPLTSLSLQPGSLKPLNIFEPRYRQMLEDSLESKTPIALVYGHHRKQWPCAQSNDAEENLEIDHEGLVAIRRTACAGLAHVVQRSEDASVLISIEGQAKIHIQNIIDDPSKPYIQAEASELEEETQLNPEDQFLYRQIQKDFQDWLDRTSAELKEHPLYRKMFETPRGMISLYTDLVIKDPILKQLVLEKNSLSEKIQILSQSLYDYRAACAKLHDEGPSAHL